MTVFHGEINWEGNYLVEPDNLTQNQTYREIPVMQGDQEVVQCIARVDEDSQNIITWDWNGNFKATTSGTMMRGDNVKYAVDTITVDIVDAAASCS